ncbi:MAG: hypothetical protein ACLFUJ_13405 [Phycisphaerae bacterium]
MVSLPEDLNDVVLFGAQQTLLLSIADWASHHDRFPLRLVASSRRADVQAAAVGAACLVIDATEAADTALKILDHVLSCRRGGNVLVYTDRMHEGLELDVRQRGVGFVLGPLTPEQWEGVFAGLGKATSGQGIAVR